MTIFPDALSQWGGVPVGVNPFFNKIINTKSSPARGRAWFVDATQGNGNGQSPATPFQTMDEAFDNLHSGDIIYCISNIDEQLTTPAQIFDVTIVGCGNQPRHADSTPEGGQYGAVTWKAPSSPTAATPLLTIQQQGWRIMNILFDGPSDAAAIQIFRDGGSGNDERDGSHAEISYCKFVAGQNHIEIKGGPSQLVITDNLFFGATAASFLNTTGAGIGTNNYFRILRNHFHNNESHLVWPTSYSSIMGNIFGKFTTAGINLTNGSENVVTLNYLYGTYSIVGGYTAGTNDEWAGNMNSISGGWTAADPS